MHMYARQLAKLTQPLFERGGLRAANKTPVLPFVPGCILCRYWQKWSLAVSADYVSLAAANLSVKHLAEKTCLFLGNTGLLLTSIHSDVHHVKLLAEYNRIKYMFRHTGRYFSLWFRCTISILVFFSFTFLQTWSWSQLWMLSTRISWMPSATLQRIHVVSSINNCLLSHTRRASSDSSPCNAASRSKRSPRYSVRVFLTFLLLVGRPDYKTPSAMNATALVGMLVCDSWPIRWVSLPCSQCPLGRASIMNVPCRHKGRLTEVKIQN